MLLLIVYISIALGFSFLCSIAEAVLLSVTVGYIAVMEEENRPSAARLRNLKEDINKPLAAILTLNTIAHTVGAAGAGAQAMTVFGSASLGAVSAVLTLLILVFSEIIPKTIGAHYWQSFAPATAHVVSILVWLLYPFVKLSELLTSSLTDGPGLKGFNRDEFSAMARVSWEDGLLEKQEWKILMNLLSMHKIHIEDAMTPQSVVFSIPESLTVAEYCEQFQSERFSRIPVYDKSIEAMDGFVLLNDILLASSRGEGEQRVSEYKRELPALLDTFPLSKAFNHLLQQRANILLVVDEYGNMQGILTLEDTLEAILGLEIIDEGDKSRDMQELARRFWRRRAKKQGFEPEKE
jgi:CBS domain containing-hemolysin-like protein